MKTYRIEGTLESGEKLISAYSGTKEEMKRLIAQFKRQDKKTFSRPKYRLIEAD